MDSKINLFKDKPDLVVKLTDDDIINVTGSVGSGKSTFGRKYKDNNEYIVISLDSVYSDNDPDTLTNDIIELRKILLQKYGDLSSKKKVYYNDLVKFIQDRNKKGIIEGVTLVNVDDISQFKGTIIIKRTARFKCYYRAAYRDFKNPAWRTGLKKWGLVKRFFHCFKRRFHHVFHQAYIEEFICKLENYSK